MMESEMRHTAVGNSNEQKITEEVTDEKPLTPSLVAQISRYFCLKKFSKSLLPTSAPQNITFQLIPALICKRAEKYCQVLRLYRSGFVQIESLQQFLELSNY